MSVASVYAILDAAIVDGVIDLWAVSANPGLPGLRGVLTLFGISSSYDLDNAAVSQGLDSVTLTGQGVFGAPGDPGGMRFPVRGTLLYVENAVGQGVFRLTLAFTGRNWVFSDFFNREALPPTQTTEPGGSTYAWAPSFLIGLSLDAAAFRADSLLGASLQLSGYLMESPVFGPYRDFIKPWPLPISGPLTMPGEWSQAPSMTLTAMTAGSTALPIGSQPGLNDGPSGLSVTQLGFELLIRNDLDPTEWGLSAFSVLNLKGLVILGNPTDGLVARVTTQLLSTGQLWYLSAEFLPGSNSVRGMAQLTTIFGLPALPLPANFPLIDTFYFRAVELCFTSPVYGARQGSPSLPTLRSLTITIGSDETWSPPVPYVQIRDVGTSWIWTWTEVYEGPTSNAMRTVSSISGSVFGTIRFGGDSSGGAELPAPSGGGGSDGTASALANTSGAGSTGTHLLVSVSLPDLFIQGDMKQGDIIPLSQAFTWYFGDPGPPTTTDKIANITALGFSADPIAQRYRAGAEIVFTTGGGELAAPGWEIDLVVIRVLLVELSLWVELNAGRIGGGIAAVLWLDQGEPLAEESPRILLQAEYPLQDPEDAVGWNFSGNLDPGTSISLTKLVLKFLGISQVPSWVPDLTVDRLYFVFSTGSSSYALGGTVSVRWTPEIFGTPLRISAAASADIHRDGAAPPTQPAQGKLSGKFEINKIALEAAMDLGAPEPTYEFKVQFGSLWFQAVTSWRGEPDRRHQAISLQLGGVTLGEILEYLVNLAAPTLGFSLDPPWDVLNRIDLSSFVLTLDPQENVVELVYKANVDLIIARVTSIGVRYRRAAGGSVDLILEGSFLGKTYEGDNALQWDVIHDPPPAVPGQGEMLVDLRYLGVGQRIRLRNPPSTVRETVAMLEQHMREVDDPKDLPGLTGPIAFSADSQWLLGLDIGLLSGTVDLGVIFNDPVLYGLSVALGGERAGSLAGLRFEILYKKITDTIGMFRVELRIPDAFRTFQLGVASFTLGTLVVEVYTNGNFMVDLGFPYDRNFERSFSVQAYVFIGRGGFYFGVLDGATSTRVPRITNGNFSPVLELGIGLAAGVGREIRAGILGGGAYVQLEVIFQGVLAWFNPDSHGIAPARYFWAQGIAALHGKVYGYVDFKVIKVSVTLEAYAQVSAVFESYRPTYFKLEVSVSAEAEVKILFFSISFSFHVDLTLDFTLGAVEQTPWILATGQGAANAPRGAAHRLLRNPRQTRSALAEHHIRRTPGLHRGRFARGDAQEEWGWNPGQMLWPDGKVHTAHFTLLPAFTVSGVPLSWHVPPGAAPAAADNDSPVYRAAFMVCADSGVDARARTAAATRRRTAAWNPLAASAEDTPSLTPDLFVQVLLLYSLYSIPGGPSSETDPVTSGQMALLVAQLESEDAANVGFALDHLNTLFDTNLHFVLSKPPGGGDPGVTIGGMFAPLPPYLSWTSPQGGDIDFLTYNSVGPWYEWGISGWLGRYFPEGGSPGLRPAVDDPAKYESFASYLFRDYCLMIARAAVQEAQQSMRTASVAVTAGSDGKTPSLRQLATAFATASVDYRVRSGDTVASVAEALGMTPAGLELLNPGLAAALASAPAGTSLVVVVGVVPEVLAADNAAQPFEPTTLQLGLVPHQVAVHETLSAISTLFQVANPATLFSVGGVSTGLGASPNLLRAHAAFDVPEVQWTSNTTLPRAAASFFSRYTVPDLDEAHWYAQAIFDMNPEEMERLFPDQRMLLDLELPPGQTLDVPAQLGRADLKTSYVTIPGDTLGRIGRTLTLEEVYPTTSPAQAPAWQTFLGEVTSPSPGTFAIPAWTGLATHPGETMESLGRRLIVNVTWTGSDPARPAAGTWAYDWNAIVAWAGPADILSPLAVVPVPGAAASAPQGGSLSFLALAQTYGLSIGEATARLQDTEDLYPAGTTLVVTDLPVQTVQQLVNFVLQGETIPRIVNQGSRMFSAGLRLPALATDGEGHVLPSTTTSLPLYDLSGQQFTVAVDPSQGDQTALSLTVTSQSGWITFAATETVRPGDTHAGLLARHPSLARLSPGVASSGRVPPGMRVLTESVSSLQYDYTNAQILAQSPATSLVVPVPALPSPLPLAGVVPRTYGLDHRIELQCPISIPIPGTVLPAASGQPSLWPFPADLAARATSDSPTPYEILATPRGEQSGRHAGSIQSATWGCVIPFKLRRVDAAYKLFTLTGLDSPDRQRVLDLISWLQQDSSGGTVAYLLAAPAPDASNTSGWSLLASAAADTFIVQANQSTDSVPPSSRARETPPPALYYAMLAQLADFLTLLWEGSVVGGTGYYIGTSPALPASLFDSDGNGTLQILVIAGTQQSVAPTGRPLLAFNNCALIGPVLDGGDTTVSVESYDDSDTITQALVPPGNVGFRLRADRPTDEDTPEQMLRNLYSLASFSVPAEAGAPFTVPASGMPVPPEPSPVESLPRWKRERLTRRGLSPVDRDRLDPLPLWVYDQVVPIYRFGPASALPEVPGLPLPEADPYRGVGTATTLPSAQFQLGFGDIFGNRTAPGGDQDVDVSVGYTDPLLGVTEWPGSMSSYQVEPAPGDTALLTVTIAPRPASLLPSPAQPGDAGAEAADRQAKKYAEAYYQVGQAITGQLITSLLVAPSPGQLDIDVGELRRFVAGSFLYSSAAARLRALVPPAGATLAGLATDYSVRYAEMAYANADRLTVEVFGDVALTIPAHVPFQLHDSAATIAAADRPGWPAPTALAILQDEANGVLPLKPGAALAVPPVTFSTGSVPGTLAALASAHGTSPGLLATENHAVAMLEPGFVFSVEVSDNASVSITVTEGQTDTLDTLVAAFALEGVNVTPAYLADSNAGKPGMLAANVTLTSSAWLAADGDTLSHNGSGVSQDQLASLNTHTPDLFDEGALVCLGNFGGAGGVHPNPAETLRQLANAYACPLQLLLQANSQLPLPAGTTFTVPGISAWPETAALAIPYVIRATDVLDELVTRFDYPSGAITPSTQFADRNANMPRLLAGDVAIAVNVGGQIVNITTPAGGESFAEALAQVRQTAPAATMADLAAAVGPMSGALRDGSLALCPPCKLAADTTPASVPGLYTVDAGLFALANVSAPDFLACGQPLHSPDGTVTVTTAPGDTFNSVIVRFAEQGVQTDAAAVAMAPANRDTAFFAAGALALLPPAPARLRANLASGGPYPGPVFPLSVSVELRRPPQLMAPHFDPDGPTGKVTSQVPAPGREQGSGGESSLTLDDFIRALVLALPSLRVATAKTGDGRHDLWAVDFGPSGISALTIHGTTTVPGKDNPQPRYFALQPLYPTLVTRSGVPIRDLTDIGQLSPIAHPTDFQGIDAEVWASRFLADVDRFLAAQPASALYLDPATRPGLQSVLESKALLASAIADGLGVILQIEDPLAPAGLVVAKERLRQQLGVSLSAAYHVSTVVQFDRTVVSPWQDPDSELLPAELNGQMTPVGGQVGDELPRAWTATAGKAWLDGSNPFVTLLMTVSDAAAHRSVSADLAFDIGFMEDNVSARGLPEGYVSSDWLSFLPPLSGANRPASLQTDLGPITVPIPLRNFPPLPIVVGQTARPSALEAGGERLRRRHAAGPRVEGVVPVSSMALWNYGFTYSHEHAEQDEVFVTAQLNLRQGVTAFRAADEPVDLFSELAKYIAVADPLWAMLEPLTTGATTDPVRLRNAVTTFASLVANVAQNWLVRQSAAMAARDSADRSTEFSYRSRVTSRIGPAGAPELGALTLTSLSAGIGPDGEWPEVTCALLGTRVKLIPEAVSPTEMRYVVPPQIPIPLAWPQFTLEWTQLNLATWQNATAHIYVQRNERLLGPDGPPTEPAFVFRTDLVRAAGVVTPLNVWSERTQIVGTPGPDYVKTALDAALASLFPSASQPGTPPIQLTLGISYAFELVPDPEDPSRSLVSEAPVLLYPDQTYGTGYTASVQAATDAWKAQNQPNTQGGEWVFALTMYSSMEAERRPLLVAERLFCGLDGPIGGDTRGSAAAHASKVTRRGS